MKKRIISVLLLLCLAAALLPVSALAAKPTAVIQFLTTGVYEEKKMLDNPTLKMNAGDPTQYFISKQCDAERPNNWYLVPSTEAEWNAKFEYPADGIPTITLKDAKISNQVGMIFGEAWPKRLKDQIPTCTTPFKLILAGENYIKSTHLNCALDFYTLGDVTITGPGSLVFDNNKAASVNTGLTGSFMTFGNLTLDNVNITLNLDPAYGKGTAFLAQGGDIVVNGGKIKVNAVDTIGKWESIDSAFYVTKSGDKGGNLTIKNGADVSIAFTPYRYHGIMVDGEFIIEESTFEIGICKTKRDGKNVMNKMPTLKYANNQYTTHTTKSKLPKYSEGVLVPAEDKYIDISTLTNLNTVSYFKVTPGGTGEAFFPVIELPPVETAPPAVTQKPTEPVATQKPTEPAATQKPTEPAATQKPTEPAATQKPTEPAATLPSDTPKDGNSGTVALIAVLAIVVLGGGFAVYWFVIKPKKQ